MTTTSLSRDLKRLLWAVGVAGALNGFVVGLIVGTLV